jgi:hypothetical protein
MSNTSQTKRVFVAFLFTLLFISMTCLAITPNAKAATLPNISNKDTGLLTLNTAIGLDLTKYSVTTKETDSNQSNLGILPQEDIQYDLISSDNVLKILSTFVDGKMQILYVLENRGTPNKMSSDASTNAVDMAKDFLYKYDYLYKCQLISANSPYGEFESSIEGLDARKNVTKTLGDTQLEVTTTGETTTFKWTYISNGVIAPSKVVALCFEKGFLKYFVDKWNFYDIGTTNINVSKEKAIDIALQTAKTYNWSIKVDDDSLTVQNFNESNVRWTSLIFDDSLDAAAARNKDLLTVYPVWRVGIALDKWYGQLYGIQVDVWADSGEVRCVQEAWSSLPQTENNLTVGSGSEKSYNTENLALLIGLPSISVAGLVAFSIWATRNRKSHVYNKLKPRLLKTGTILLCLLIASTLAFGAIETVAASRAAIIWGSESNGAGIYPTSWRKSQTEIDYQRAEAIAINSFFSSNGYTSVNRQGNLGSTRSQIHTDLSYYQSNYNYLAVVDFDHGVGLSPGYPTIQAPPDEFHYIFEDDNGTLWGPQASPTPHPEHGVYDMEIRKNLTSATVCFALINTCLSANTTFGNGPKYGGGFPDRSQGMPYAWTGRIVLSKSNPNFNKQIHISDDGYGNPDNGPQVYIGFTFGAASLMQHIPYDTGTQTYYSWVNWFFHYALFEDVSVNQALDYATAIHWPGYTFGNGPLQSFTAYWWNLGTWANCKMAVYGNGNIFLKYYEPHHVGMPSVGGPTTGYVNTQYQFNASSVASCGNNVRYTFYWGDNTQTTTGWYSSGQIATATHSWSSENVYQVSVRAECADGVLSGYSTAHTMNIGNFPLLTVRAYRTSTGQELYGVPVWLDNNYVGTTPYSTYVTPASHQIYVPTNLYFTSFRYFYYNGGYNSSDPVSVSITSDKTVIAWYY